MPKAVSQKQFRMMMAIAHGKRDPHATARGTPPESVASQYTSPGKDAPEQSGKDSGGHWTEGHTHRHKKKHKDKVKKSFDQFYKATAAGALVLNGNGEILMGLHESGKLAFPGGHSDAVDYGSQEYTALRELKEETGLVGRNPIKMWQGKLDGNDSIVYLMESFTGKPTASKELKNLKWIKPSEIDWSKIRSCCIEPLKTIIEEKFGKSLDGMLSLEKLQKNIIRQKGSAVYEINHGDALKLVGNGLFRQLQAAISDMQDEDFKDVNFDTYVLSIRKHMSDVYSGRVNDGHKMIYQFVNKSLPELTAALMSVFEWYSPDDEHVFDVVDQNALPDDAIEGGLQALMDHYKQYNIGNIYQEMDTIRQQVRNGAAIDVQQVEARIMKLFDKLEQTTQTISAKHNTLISELDKEFADVEFKLREIQQRIDELGKKPQVVEAYSSNPPNSDKIIDNFYPYLSKPKIEILPSGKITIFFESDWQNLEKENFLQDMRAKVIKNK